MTARTQSFRLFIMLSALLALLLLACTPDRAPTPTPVQPPTATAAPFEPAPASASAPVASETAGAAPMPSATLPATSTALPSLAATNTSLPEATAQPPASPVPADTRAPVTIDAFEVDVQDVASGKRLTFRWETTGADRVQIFAGTQQQSPPTWHGGPDGALDAELPATNYRDPPMTLVAYYAPDHLVVEETVTRTRTIEWPCQFDYFFEPEPAACPVEAPVSTWAAEQMFEHGRMLWLQEVWVGDVVQDNLIFVLYDDGRWNGMTTPGRAISPRATQVSRRPKEWSNPFGVLARYGVRTRR